MNNGEVIVGESEAKGMFLCQARILLAKSLVGSR
nr:MAG TPA: hypothetical protein [Caudoviricetes sp.]